MAYQMHFGPVLDRAPEFVDGTINTILLSGQGIVIGLAIGLAVAIIRVEGPRWLDRIIPNVDVGGHVDDSPFQDDVDPTGGPTTEPQRALV